MTSRTVSINLNNFWTGPSNERIRVDGSKNSTHYDFTDSESSLLILFDECGIARKRLRYRITDPAPQESFINIFIPPCSIPFLESLSCENRGVNGNFDNVVLISSLTINDSARISGTLKVPNGVVLTIENAEAIFATGAKIQVMPGGKLVIKSSYLHGCDGQSWDGIEVKGNNSLSAQLVIERTRIADAIVAVSADKTNEISITESAFSNGTTAIEMNKVKGFSISKNEITQYIYGIRSSNTIIGPSVIRENIFSLVRYAIYFDNDKHSQLDVKCNKFDNYTDYAIYSDNSILKDQGSATEGAGNEFTSSSTFVNNKFAHNGNAITYYTDPSNPISLITGAGMNVSTVASSSDAMCNGGKLLSQKDAETTEVMGSKELNCFPNPASNKATFVYSLPEESSSAEIRVMNLLGKLIAKYPLAPGTSSLDADCSAFKNGIYLYSLIIDNRLVNTKKMIITK